MLSLNSWTACCTCRQGCRSISKIPGVLRIRIYLPPFVISSAISFTVEVSVASETLISETPYDVIRHSMIGSDQFQRMRKTRSSVVSSHPKISLHGFEGGSNENSKSRPSVSRSRPQPYVDNDWSITRLLSITVVLSAERLCGRWLQTENVELVVYFKIISWQLFRRTEETYTRT